MNLHRNTNRVASATLLAAIVLASMPAPVTLAGTVSPTCRVRNVTQDTVGYSFPRMVAAAHRGDLLRVRGTCSGGVTIRKDLRIEGVGPDATLSGRGRFRVLDIRPKADWTGGEPHVRIRDMRIVRGRTTGGGGGIRVYYAKLTLTDSFVRGNAAGAGGGLSINGGTVTLRRSVVRGNTTTGSGGGLAVSGEVLTLVDSLVRDNRAAYGGGIYDSGLGILKLIDSSVRRNTAGRSGGGILTEGTLWMRGSSVTNNAAGTDGGGIHHYQMPWEVVELVGSTVTGNTAAGHGGGIYIISDEDDYGDRVFTLTDTTVSANDAGVDGGGIYAVAAPVLSLTGSSAVTDNDPNDCVGAPAC